MGFWGKLVAVGVYETAKKITDKIIKNKDRKDSNEYIKVDSFIDDLIGENYKDVKESLEGYGFTNISCIAKKDLKRELKKGFLFSERNEYEDGEVEEISINGETNFKKNDMFLPNAKVTVKYHTYIGSATQEKEEENKSFKKCSHCGAAFEYSNKKPKCPYCGNPIIE